MDSFFRNLIDELKSCPNPESLYQKIISIGKSSPLVSKWDFNESERVLGCQSTLYVKSHLAEGKIFFNFFSDAIISQGLAALLVHFYQGQTPKLILTTPPTFIKELNLGHLLSPGRSNGLNSLYKKILEIAISRAKEA